MCDNQSNITVQWSSGATTQPATTSMMALDLSDATTQSADHNASSTRASIKFKLDIFYLDRSRRTQLQQPAQLSCSTSSSRTQQKMSTSSNLPRYLKISSHQGSFSLQPKAA
ncbi:hypothetical protein F511_27705 [Dorcoceras hygrometricum]|uniref:Uncharacterized protein n=1 Tax=Dorcoceras hygrometricum TaxID=472368 RepID=A0A2Z7BTI2_9LAMI|nr:hypothetical protein F511_27705 [Dorcoceras hygrometricum]